MNILINTNRDRGYGWGGGIPDSAIPVAKLGYSKQSNTHSKSVTSNGKPFIKGPIPLDWLGIVAKLPGKCLNVAMAICWLTGMSDGKPFKLTAKALRHFNVSNDTARDCLHRMELAGLIHVNRQPGQRPRISIREIVQGDHHGKT
jgi:hypothetical protein